MAWPPVLGERRLPGPAPAGGSRPAGQFLGAGRGAQTPRLCPDRQGRGRPGRAADAVAGVRAGHAVRARLAGPDGCGVVSMNRPVRAGDPIEQYLTELRRGLRRTPGEVEAILAEAEDHLRETVAAGIRRYPGSSR